MPELPEVETVKNGLAELIGTKLSSSIIRFHTLRYPLDKEKINELHGLELKNIIRRAKYIIFVFANNNYIIMHLGMSGKVTLIKDNKTVEKHDHVDLIFGKLILRYNDPRRFGCILSGNGPWQQHKLLENLGPEPLTDEFNPDYLMAKALTRSITLKQFIMDNSIVVGVGNIYACESLFMSHLAPTKKTNTLTRDNAVKLVQNIKSVLIEAIAKGGSTLKDYSNAKGEMGYFQQQHLVYGRAGKPCKRCDGTIEEMRLGQRNSFYCPKCQK